MTQFPGNTEREKVNSAICLGEAVLVTLKIFLCLLEWCFKDAEQRHDAKWSPVLKKGMLFKSPRECDMDYSASQENA